MTPTMRRMSTPEAAREEGATPSSVPTPDALRGRALALLTRRDHSQAELRQKLLDRGGAPALVEQILADLADRKLQSDDRFAEAFIRSRAERGYGPRVIAVELKSRGLNAESIDEALAASGYDWFRQAREVRQRRFGHGVPREARERARQMRFLQYRGFTGEQISRALKAERPDDD